MKTLSKEIMKKILYILIVLCLFSCKEKNTLRQRFEIPEIVNTQFDISDSSYRYEAEAISHVFPTFAGKYKFQERVDINPWLNDTTYSENYKVGCDSFVNLDSLDVNGFV